MYIDLLFRGTVYLDLFKVSYANNRPIPCHCQPAQVPGVDTIGPADFFPSMFVDGEDLWKDARMSEVIKYLYGGTGTRVPSEWHGVIPPKV